MRELIHRLSSAWVFKRSGPLLVTLSHPEFCPCRRRSESGRNYSPFAFTFFVKFLQLQLLCPTKMIRENIAKISWKTPVPDSKLRSMYGQIGRSRLMVWRDLEIVRATYCHVLYRFADLVNCPVGFFFPGKCCAFRCFVPCLVLTALEKTPSLLRVYFFWST